MVSDDFIDDSVENFVEARWKDFWEEILVKEDGSIDLEQLKKELSDFYVLIHYIPEIYCEITGGMVSKHMTAPSAVLSCYRNQLEDQYEYAREEVTEELVDEFQGILRWLSKTGKKVL